MLIILRGKLLYKIAYFASQILLIFLYIYNVAPALFADYAVF